MAITYPLSLQVFANKLAVTSTTWAPGYQQEYSALGSGFGIGADLGPALRDATVSTVAMESGRAAEVVALIETLAGILHPFYMYDPRKRAPRHDPTGAILTAAGLGSPVIYSLNANNKAMQLSNLPPGYVVSAGDLLSWDFGTNPVRRAFHRVVETVTVASNGRTPEFEVRDFIRPGSAPGLAVSLLDPAGKFKMVKDSLRDESVGRTKTRISFSMKQTL